MIGESETSRLTGFAKKLIDNKRLKKIKKINDKKEKIETLKYIIKSELDMMHYGLLRKLRKKENDKKDVFSAEVKMGLLNSRIKYFIITYNKKDFKNVINLYNEIKKELNNV